MAALFSAALLWLQPATLVNTAPSRLGPFTEIHGWPTPAFVCLRFDNVFYTLNICAECCRGSITHRCDGSTLVQSWNNTTCTHLRRPLPDTSYIDAQNRHRMQGRPAYELLHTIKDYIDHHGTAGERELFRPILRRRVWFKHTECLYSACPRTVIHGADGIARSLYFRRCNGDYVNAVGEGMDIA